MSKVEDPQNTVGLHTPIVFESLSFFDQAAIRKTVRDTLEGEYIKKYEQESAQRREDNTKAIQEALAKMQREAKPPSVEEIEQLLAQDYVSMTVKLPVNGKTREFTLGELPLGVERKFLKMLMEKLRPRFAELNQLIGTNLLEGTVEAKAQAVLELLDPSAEILSALVAMILNPYGREIYDQENAQDSRKLDGGWVIDNVPLWRCWNVLMAQSNINRLKDFFSAAFQDSNAGMIPNRANSLR